MPLSGAADLIRPVIAARREVLNTIRPEAIDLAAEFTAILHAQLHGRATCLHGDRGENYRRQQLRGEHPITVEDLGLLLLEAPGAVALALAPLAARAGYDLVPAAPVVPDLEEATAAVAEMAGSVVAHVTRAGADDVIDDQEDAAISGEIQRLERRVAALKGAVRGQRRAQRGGR